MINSKYQVVVFAFFMSLMMSFMMSFFITLINLGLIEGFFIRWMTAFFSAWGIAFPIVIVVAPLVRRLVGVLVKAPEPK